MADPPGQDPHWSPDPALLAKPAGHPVTPVGDLVIAVGLLGIAAIAAWQMEPGTLRLVLTLPALAIIPGYVMLQAALVPARAPLERAGHAIFALGLSPAYLALVALTTTFTPDGFRAGPILGWTLAGTFVLAVAAFVRRRSWRHVAAEIIAAQREGRARGRHRKARPKGDRPVAAKRTPPASRTAATPKSVRRDEEAWQSR